jgi:hypothetical protein
VQQPPAQAEVTAVCLKVVTVGGVGIVIVVLEGYAGAFGRWRGCCQRDDRGEVVAPPEQIELDAGEKGEEGERVEQREGARHGAYLQVVPQLGLCAAGLVCRRWRCRRWHWHWDIGDRRSVEGDSSLVKRGLAGVDIAVGVHAGAATACVIVDCVGDAAGNLAGANAACETLGLLTLQLVERVLDGQRIDNLVRGGGQDGQDGEGAVFLVLLESTAQAVQVS